MLFCVPAQLKLNTDESPAIATEYGIRSIPTVMLFKVCVRWDHLYFALHCVAPPCIAVSARPFASRQALR